MSAKPFTGARPRMEIFDQYDLRARFLPGLLCLFPAIAVFGLLFSDASPLLGTSLTAFGGLAGSALLVHFIRDYAREKEKVLFASWGGMPSVTRFRHRDQRTAASEKERLHKKMQALVPETAGPSPAEEAADPARADVAYTRWSDHLRKKTRDKAKYGLVFQENMDYGFRRNLWAMKVIGLPTALCCLLVVVAMSLQFLPAFLPPPYAAISLLVSAIMTCAWLVAINPKWVHAAADRYAVALHECADSL